MTAAEAPPEEAQVDLALRSVLPLATLRRRLATALADVGDERLDDVLLVGNELVSNAYRHGGSPRPVRLERHGDRVRIEVDDASPHRLPVLSPPGTSTTKSGFGLVVVARLSEQWGVDQYNDHKTVWAELATA